MRIVSVSFAGLLLGLFTASAHASVITEVSGNIGAGFRVGGGSEQAEYAGWGQSDAYSGVSITAVIGSLSGSSEIVDAYLTTAIGPAATNANVIAFASVSVNSFALVSEFTSVTIFSGLSLNAGTYYLTLFNTNPSGEVRWARGNATSGAATFQGFANNGGDGIIDTVNPWKSDFVSSTLNDNAFSVKGTIVPEPSTLCMASIALVGLGLAARRLR